MSEQELNKRRAEWAGFIEANKSCSSCGINYNHLHDPNGRASPMPDFPQSLDACFKWLVPKLFELGYWLKTTHYHSMYDQNVSHSLTIGQHDFTGEGEFTKAETFALALCQAIDKLIEEVKVK